MAERLLIVIANTDPHNPAQLGAPFFQATVAAAMDYPVEVVFTGSAGELAVKGLPEKLLVMKDSKRSVYEFMQEAHEAGVRFSVCTPSVEFWGDELIPEIDQTVGAAYIISKAMEEGTVTFTY